MQTISSHYTSYAAVADGGNPVYGVCVWIMKPWKNSFPYANTSTTQRSKTQPHTEMQFYDIQSRALGLKNAQYNTPQLLQIFPP